MMSQSARPHRDLAGSQLDAYPLWAASVRPSTRVAYDKNLRNFLHYTGLDLPQLLHLSARRVDRRLAKYIHHLHRTRGSYTYASHTLHGLILHHPILKGNLPISARSLKGWDKVRTKRSYPPITWEVAVAMSLSMARSGRHAEAVAALLAFECCLRSGEMLRLQFGHVAVRNDPDFGSAHTRMALKLAKTKTVDNLPVSVRDPIVEDVLQQYLDSREWQETDLLFPFSRSHWVRCLKKAAAALGLGHIGIVPHSLRHGCATRDYLRGMTIEQIKLHGRWESLKSARLYIQQGPALLLNNQVSRQLMDDVAPLLAVIPQSLEYLRQSVPQRLPRPTRRVRFARRPART